MKEILHIHARVWNKGDHGLTLAIQQLLRGKLRRVRFRDYDIKKLKTEGFGRIAKLAPEYDAVVIGGGGLYGRWLFPLDVSPLAKAGTPVILYSVGYDRTLRNPGLTASGWKSIAELNRLATLSSARDKLTLQKLRERGIRKAVLVPDPGMFLEPKRKKLPLKKKDLNIGLNIAYHWWMRLHEPSREVKLPMRRKVFDSVVETCSALQNCFGAKIYYMPHFYTEKSVLRRLKRKFEIRQLSLSPQQMVYAYGRFNQSITMNMHSAIFSFNVGTPFINISYNEKNPAFCRLAGMQDYCLDISRLGEMLPASLELLAEENSLRKKLVRRKRALWRKEESFLNRIKKTIK
jgi:polysaccharide pyruvyl transferase WcaK-like protein